MATFVALAVLSVLLVRRLMRPDEEKATVAPVAENHPPEIQSLELSLSDTDVMARAIGRDADGDRFRFHYRWTVAGKPQPGRRAMISRSMVPAGAIVEVEATPVDGRGARGRPMRSTLTMESTAP